MTSGTHSSSALRVPARPSAGRIRTSSGFRFQLSGFSAGFTLVELLVGATLSAAVLLAVLSSYTYLGRNLARLANQQILGSEARRTVAQFAQDVRKASGLTDTSNLSASRVSLTVPTTTGTASTVTYYYNNSSSATSVTINGTSVSMAANALTRCVYNGSTVTSLALLNNITSSGLTLLYYDSSGNVYTSYTNYLPGIKQVALQFSIQKGYAQNGTLSQIQQVTTGRLTLRNRSLLQ